MTEQNDAVDTDTQAQPEAPQNGSQSSKGDLPDWARQQISSANAEAAQRRVELKTAKEENQTLHEKVQTLSSKVSEFETVATSRQADFDKLVTAVQSLFPEEQNQQVFTFAKTLQGSNGEELANHAAELTRMFRLSSGPSPAVDRSQGLGSGAPANDPASEFAALLNSQLG